VGYVRICYDLFLWLHVSSILYYTLCYVLYYIFSGYTYVTKEFRHLGDTEFLNNGNSPGIELYLNEYYFRILNAKYNVAFEKHILI